MKKCLAAAALIISAMNAVPALAGFTAVTTTDTVETPGTPGLPPAIGDLFYTSTPGGFASFTPDTAADPQVNGDLSAFKYTLTGAVSSVNLTTGVIGYSGTYEIFYDVNGNNAYDPLTDTSVSTGTFTLTADFAGNNASLAGTLTETLGPSGPYASSFRDLSEGGSPVIYTGSYDGTDPDVSGTIQGTLRQNASVPEPTSLSLLGLGALGLLRRRSRAQA